MPLHSTIDPKSPEFARNADVMRGLVAELRDKLKVVSGGGGETSRKRHTSRGKMLARERVDLLVDPGTAFLELSPLAAHGLYGGDVHSASVITGVGRISGRECVIVANDATIKGGTYYPLTVKKHLRAQDIARQNNLPCVYMVDSGGAFLPMQDEIFPDERHFGRIFYNQAQMSSQGIPQNAVSPYYDAMLAKVIAWAPTRQAAIERLNRGLEETDVRGIVTNIPFLSALMTHPKVRANAIDTGFIERELKC